MSPKRSVFSLNVDSDAQIIEPAANTDLSHVVKPTERAVNTAIDDVVSSTGKSVKSVQGDLHYSTEKSSSSSKSTSHSSNLSIKNPSTRRAIERKYDTSDL
jgi:Flp pilus assembly protein CpaB